MKAELLYGIASFDPGIALCERKDIGIYDYEQNNPTSRLSYASEATVGPREFERITKAGERTNVEFKLCGSQPGSDTFETVLWRES